MQMFGSKIPRLYARLSYNRFEDGRAKINVNV